MFFYAQINGNNVVHSVSCLAGDIEKPDMIRIDSYDQSLLGKKYNQETGKFEDMPPEE